MPGYHIFYDCAASEAIPCDEIMECRSVFLSQTSTVVTVADEAAFLYHLVATKKQAERQKKIWDNVAIFQRKQQLLDVKIQRIHCQTAQKDLARKLILRTKLKLVCSVFNFQQHQRQKHKK